MTSRDSIRKTMREQRRALTEQQQQAFAIEFANHFSKSSIFFNSQRIAFYLANDAELDPAMLLNIAWSMGKSCYLPVLAGSHNNNLLFAPYNPGELLVHNRFGIGEPNVAARRQVKARNMDLIIMPLVAYDKSGNRIGMGGGYYDRTLGFLKLRTKWRKPRLLGIGYSFQQVASIKSESWDVSLTHIGTESGLIEIKA